MKLGVSVSRPGLFSDRRARNLTEISGHVAETADMSADGSGMVRIKIQWIIDYVGRDTMHVSASDIQLAPRNMKVGEPVSFKLRQVAEADGASHGELYVAYRLSQKQFKKERSNLIAAAGTGTAFMRPGPGY